MDPQPDALAGTVMPALPGRSPKPRQVGLTVVMDKGLGPAATRDLLVLSGPYIDFCKPCSGMDTG